MLETKLEYSVNQLINNHDPQKKQLYLDEVGKLLLNISYFKKYMQTYPDLGPLTYTNLINNLKFKKYKQKTIIWDYNDTVDGVYIIISGEIKIYKQPDKTYLKRCKNIQKREKAEKDEYIINKSKNINTSFVEKFGKTNKNQVSRATQYSINLIPRRSKIFCSNIPQPTKIIKKKRKKKLRKSLTAEFTSELNLDIPQHQNISNNELQITMTDKNYLFREPQESRRLDYIETFGKMIGEDALLQELTHRKYACETSNDCILAFLSAKNYHIFFDRINNSKKGNMILFLYKVNYFNNKNDFLHRLCKAIRIKNYKNGTVIYNKNNPFISMYIIKKGTVSINITKETKYKSDLDSDLVLKTQRIKRKNKSYNDLDKIKIKESLNHFTNDRNFELKGEYSEKKVYTIVNYEKGEIFGNLEYFWNSKHYLFTAKCITDVELYEIDIQVFKKIQKPYNIEFFLEKTKQQIKYFLKRITEINSVHTKNDDDQNKSRNKFMKIFYQRNPISSSKIAEKYINNGKNFFPIKLRYQRKKFKNTKISPFYLYEYVSALNNKNNNKSQKTKNLFITNNLDFTKLFNGKSTQKNSFLNFENEEKNIKNNTKIFENIKEPKIKSHKKSFSAHKIVNNNIKPDDRFRGKSISFNSNYQIFKIEKKYKHIEAQKKIHIDKEDNNTTKQKNDMRQSLNVLNLKYFLKKENPSQLIKNFINVYQKVQKDNFENQQRKMKEKRTRIEKKRVISSAIAFNGYRVYLQKNKKFKLK